MTRSHHRSRARVAFSASFVAAVILASCSRPADPPNLVLIVVDTLRADRLSLYGNSRVTSPHLDAWAASRAIVFEEVVAAAPLTLPSHVSIFSGLDAHRHGVNHDGRVPGSIPLLAPLLREAGYATVAVTGGGYLHPSYGLDRGFDRFFHWSGDTDEPPATELESNIELALEVLDGSGPEPFFLFFHTYEVHEPYLPRSPFFEAFYGNHPPPTVRLDHHQEHGPTMGFVDRRRLGILEAGNPGSWSSLPPDQAQLPFDLYDSSIAFTDLQLSSLLQRLQELDSHRPTLVVFTSDHGEMLGEHGLAGHASLQSEALLVPLIMALPGGRYAGTRIKSTVRSIDILPTVLELLGLAAPSGIDGVSLLPTLTKAADRSSQKPPAAWSYASKPNLGLVIRPDAETRILFNHTVWEPARRDVRVVGEDGQLGRPDDPGDNWAETARELVATTVARLEEETPGLRIRMRNTASKSIFGEIRGKAIHPARVKSVDLPCVCIAWLGDHRTRFEIPPATTYTLIIEQVDGWDLEILLDHPANTVFEFDLSELHETQSLIYAGPAWQRVDRDPLCSTTAITLWWKGGLPEPEVVIEAELQDQLRRLGYLD